MKICAGGACIYGLAADPYWCGIKDNDLDWSIYVSLTFSSLFQLTLMLSIVYTCDNNKCYAVQITEAQRE